MKMHIVLYRIKATQTDTDNPFGFCCTAEDKEEAEKQCSDAVPNGDVVWVYEVPEGVGRRNAYPSAVRDYWGTHA